MQSQIVCSGCRTVLLYPRGATNVCCVVCNVMTLVPSAEMEMTQLICGGCHMLLTHTWGATSVPCSYCHTMNLVPAASSAPVPDNFAHFNCPSCHTMLMFPAGAPLVKCAICSFITNVDIRDSTSPISFNQPGGVSTPSTSMASAYSQNQTVVVQNPSTVDENGKLVRNVVVGVTT